MIKYIATTLLMIICLFLLIGCDSMDQRKGGNQQDSTRSLCGDFPSMSHHFNDFHFLDGQWHCSDILKCQGGSLYTDSLLQIARSSYLCAQLPHARFSTVNSFGIQVYESGIIDMIQWEKSIINDGNHRISGSLRCDYQMNRKEVRRFSMHFPNNEQWFEYIADDTIGFFYDSYFFILTKDK